MTPHAEDGIGKLMQRLGCYMFSISTIVTNDTGFYGRGDKECPYSYGLYETF
jgi:hypothetical protein